MSEPVATTMPRPAAPKGNLPAGVMSSRYWKETPDGPLIKHDRERPVDEASDCPIGLWWMCPDADCKTGEWVFRHRDTGEAGRPKKPYCSDHGMQLLPGRSEATASDPKQAARNWLQQRMAEKSAAARTAASNAARARIAAIRQAGREEAAQLRSDLREHVPSGAASLAALITDYALLEKLPPLETYAVGTVLSIGGAVLAYLAVYAGELVYARRMGYTIKELPAELRARARSHARWIASGVLASGVWLLIGEAIGAELDNIRGILMSLFGAVLIGVVNYRPWAQMVARRKAEARAKLDAAEAAARAEEDRLAAAQAERERRRHEAEGARLAAEEAALANARKIVDAEDDIITAGRKFSARWDQVAQAAKDQNMLPGLDLTRTRVLPEETRKLTTKVGDQETVVGHEFLISADPGVLAPRPGSDVSPFLGIKQWLISMLQLNTGMLDLAYQPHRVSVDAKAQAEPETLVNHGLVTLYDTFPLGEPIKHPGPKGVFIDDRGTRWGFAGRDLRGETVYRRHYTPGQAGGSMRIGVTGMGKSVCMQVTAYNDLLLGILPVLHDAGKNAMDLISFYGIVPVGHTIEHREVIRESMWAEMKRRQAWINTRTAFGLGGMEVPANPTWDTELGGPPIRSVWSEFHMHMRDQRFVRMLGEMIRLQRATAIMAETETQGSGLADMGDQNLKEQLAEICLQIMRVSDHTARLSGYTGLLMPSSLPALAGMMIMQEFKGEPTAYRGALIRIDEKDPESLIYRLKQPNGTPEGEQILFAPDLPPETIEVFRRHGLMDLWELGKTKSGRERLQSEADPVESTALPLDALLAARGFAAPASKPKMRADEVVLAMLKNSMENGRPYMAQADMLASLWWQQIEGEWSKNSGVPHASTVSRACDRLAGGEQPAVIKDDADKKQAKWSLTPAGIERAEAALMVLRAAGVLGQQAKAQVQASGVDVAAIERQALMEAEQQALIQDLIREASAAMNG